jgi:hypothetical protein
VSTVYKGSASIVFKARASLDILRGKDVEMKTIPKSKTEQVLAYHCRNNVRESLNFVPCGKRFLQNMGDNFPFCFHVATK